MRVRERQGSDTASPPIMAGAPPETPRATAPAASSDELALHFAVWDDDIDGLQRLLLHHEAAVSAAAARGEAAPKCACERTRRGFA